jgi:hypothetical protein
MVLGYILICGLSPLTPNATEGCAVLTQEYANEATREEGRAEFVEETAALEEFYVDDSDCIVIGTGA